MKGKCQWEECREKAEFGINRLNKDGSKDWVHVCDRHEKVLAKRNLDAAHERESAKVPKGF